jgi:hypothetical protein
MKKRRASNSGRQLEKWLADLSSLATRHALLLVTGAALVVYLLTMAPGITWKHAGRDGGDFITAAWVLGVPHPTGYPTYTLLARVFTWLPLGSVAWRVNLFSGMAGTGAVALLYLLGRRLLAREESAPATLGAAVGALLLAFAPLFWGHSLVAEVYALHLFFIALVLWLMLRWRDGEGPLPLAALAFGLGMGNHITLTFVTPVILLLLWSGRERLSWRGVILSVPALVAGLSVYLYLPWRAGLDPIVNWGDPDTWENFRWVVGGQGYRRFFFALPSEKLGPRLSQWWNLTADQFFVLAWPLALLGLWELARRDRWLALGTLVHTAINLIYSIGYNVTDAFVHLLPVYFYLALWMGQGASSLLAATYRLGTSRRRPTGAIRLVTVGLLLLPLISLAGEWGEMDLTHEQRAQAFAQDALNIVEPGSMILVGADAYTFALWYYRYVEQLRPDVLVVNDAMMGFDWYRHTVAIHHPEVAQPGEGATRTTRLDLILRNLDERAVYLTKDVKEEGDLPGLELTQVGELWQVTLP